MPLDPKLRTTMVQAFAVTVEAPVGSTPDTGRASVSIPIRISDRATERLSDPGTPSDLGRDSHPGMRGPSMLPEEGHVIAGLYRLVRLLGQGMFGKVYVAQRLDVPEHQAALKLLPRSLYASRNVERELVMLATVGHPNVVQLKDHGMTADYVWLTMPVYEGETLGERLERGPLTLREAYDVFVPVARGLEALHAAGLRHQDVKPDNIYLARFGGRIHPILLDLGVAAEREATFCAGTALYAAPEQIRALNAFPGAVPLDEKMDTYCLAATLLVALAGGEHFPGELAQSRADLEEAHHVRADRPLADAALPEVQGRARALIEEAFKRWLAIDAKQRPTMAQMAEELEVLLEPEREAAREEEAFRARQRASLTRFRIAAAGALVIGIAGALLMFSKRETLRLANELERARREQGESFDKLDTCVASHQLAQQQAQDCRSAREQDKAEYQQAVAAIERSGTASSAEHARELQDMQAKHAARLKVCEESADAAAEKSLAEREKLVSGWDKERAALVAERDEARTVAEQRAAEVATLTEQKTACDAARATCEKERAASIYDPSLVNASHSAKPSSPPAPAPQPAAASTGGSPAAPPAPPAPPAQTAAPAAPPATPPPASPAAADPGQDGNPYD